MKKQSAIVLLIELAQQRSDAVAKKLKLVLKHTAEAQQKLQLLQGYRADYLRRLGTGAQQGMDFVTLQNFRAFLAKLDQAVEQQARETQAFQERVQNITREWEAQQRRVKSFNVLKARHDVGAAQRELRKLQKELDEFASRREAAKAAG
jgi:flagellar protein FliJ